MYVSVWWPADLGKEAKRGGTGMVVSQTVKKTTTGGERGERGEERKEERATQDEKSAKKHEHQDKWTKNKDQKPKSKAHFFFY